MSTRNMIRDCPLLHLAAPLILLALFGAHRTGAASAAQENQNTPSILQSAGIAPSPAAVQAALATIAKAPTSSAGITKVPATVQAVKGDPGTTGSNSSNVGAASRAATAPAAMSPSQRNGTASGRKLLFTAGEKGQHFSPNACPEEYYNLAANYLDSNFVQAGSLSQGFCSGDDARGAFSQAVWQQAINAYGGNVMVFATNQQNYHWENGPNNVVLDCTVECTDLFAKYSTLIPVQFHVWAFHGSSAFQNDGDGGFINWCFGGSFDRNDKHVQFNNN